MGSLESCSPYCGEVFVLLSLYGSKQVVGPKCGGWEHGIMF